jgi:hypothetical protein
MVSVSLSFDLYHLIPNRKPGVFERMLPVLLPHTDERLPRVLTPSVSFWGKPGYLESALIIPATMTAVRSSMQQISGIPVDIRSAGWTGNTRPVFFFFLFADVCG